MRTPTALLLVVLSAGAALADCPPDCVPGGGPAATDCFVAFSGIPATTVTCTDGESCDTDGKADGICTLPLQACINVAGLSPCVPSGLTAPPTVKPSNDPAAQQLAAALQALSPAVYGCTPPGIRIPLKVSVQGIKPGKSRLTVAASSGGKTDKDKLRLTCVPSKAAPSFSRDVQPIFTSTCATSNCHSASFKGGGQVLEPGVAYGDTVGVRSREVPKLLRVKPGSIKGSFLARKILGERIPPGVGGGTMPQGCSPGSPAQGCLTPEQVFTILSWIANGAPNN